jgi:hypothetical protein
VKLAGQTLTDSDPCIGISKEMVKRRYTVNICLRHTGFLGDPSGAPRPKTTLLLEMLKDLFSIGVFWQHNLCGNLT